VVTCEIKLFKNYFSYRRRPTEIISQLFERLIAAREYLSNMFNVAEIISTAEIILDVATCEIKH